MWGLERALYAPLGTFSGPRWQEAAPAGETPDLSPVSPSRVDLAVWPAHPVQPSDIDSRGTLGLVSLLQNSILMS